MRVMMLWEMSSCKPAWVKRLNTPPVTLILLGSFTSVTIFQREPKCVAGVVTWKVKVNTVLGKKKRKLPFRFHRVCVGHESYHGKHIQLRYYVQITLHRKWLPAVIHTQDVWMMSPRLPEPVETLYNIRMEVGIERLLHLEMEYSRSVYFTDECILGKVYFLDLHANLKNMMICLQRKEVLNIGSGCHAESENLFLFEFMDGAPAAGECIPLRLDLKALPYLTPTYKNALGKFSVVYVLNLILVDEEDKKYFKTQEITLCRRPLVCAPTTAL
eukprot:PhF_6_TR15698/c0_g1_i1/m.24426/K18466/VPS26; vacuolar protein sorting-associated protein 26